jgi:hypothetical protein
VCGRPNALGFNTPCSHEECQPPGDNTQLLRTAVFAYILRDMTPKQYRAALDQLDLTQSCAAEFLSVSLRTAHGYANGKPIPESTAKLLRLMVRLNLSPDEVK